MEIENSLVVDGAAYEDEAVSTLVNALNANADFAYCATWSGSVSSTGRSPRRSRSTTTAAGRRADQALP